MKGDFTRLDWGTGQHYSRVLVQQGRVTLDADANSASAIVLHHLRTLSRDLFGAAGGPADGSAFALALDTTEQPARLSISAGHYYVDGILVEVDADCDYTTQPDYVPDPPDEAGNGGDALLRWLRERIDARFWLYLDVWERHVTWIEDDHIRESALGGPDTCTRAKVIWQLKALPWRDEWVGEGRSLCEVPMDSLEPLGRAQMAASVDPGEVVDDPCSISPQARYRGAENHLYRVEIHRGGTAGAATFKWSRDNGSIATRWLATFGDDLVVKSSRGFTAGDWIELSHDALDLAGLPGPLLRLAKVAGDRLTLAPGSTPIAWGDHLANPKVRRWDQRSNDDIVLQSGAVPISESSATDPGWIALEDGLRIRFAEGGEYLSGDYWAFRASVATGGIDWPADSSGEPALLDPLGIEHHYASLGILTSDGEALNIEPCRRCVEIPAVACRLPAGVRTRRAPVRRVARPAPVIARPAGANEPSKRRRRPK